MLALSHQCECWGTKIISITEEFLSRNRRIVFSLSQCFVDRDDFFQYDFIIEISVNFECLEACHIDNYFYNMTTTSGYQRVRRLPS